MITQTSNTTYEAIGRGMTLKLSKVDYSFGQWMVEVDNAAARAWNRGRSSAKYFANLAEVESKYKAFRGIEALIGAEVAA